MHEDQIDNELKKFYQAAKDKGKLKIPMEFASSPIIEYTGTEMDIEPKYIKKNKTIEAVTISTKKNKEQGLSDL